MGQENIEIFNIYTKEIKRLKLIIISLFIAVLICFTLIISQYVFINRLDNYFNNEFSQIKTNLKKTQNKTNNLDSNITDLGYQIDDLDMRLSEIEY